MGARALSRAPKERPRCRGTRSDRHMQSFAGVHHVDLVVSSIERSLPFYRELLAPLGFHRVSEVEGEGGETIWSLSGAGCSLGLRESASQSDGPRARYRVGLPHRALEAGSRAGVDE